MPSLSYNTPPDELEGLIALPNGMMAAYVGKKLYFSVPYQPHAWPEKYVLTVEHEIMGLGAMGTSIVVTTEAHPYLVSGSTPESMVSQKIEQNLACINKRSVVDLGYAIAYASNNGLVVARPTADRHRHRQHLQPRRLAGARSQDDDRQPDRRPLRRLLQGAQRRRRHLQCRRPAHRSAAASRSWCGCQRRRRPPISRSRMRRCTCCRTAQPRSCRSIRPNATRNRSTGSRRSSCCRRRKFRRMLVDGARRTQCRGAGGIRGGGSGGHRGQHAR